MKLFIYRAYRSIQSQVDLAKIFTAFKRAATIALCIFCFQGCQPKINVEPGWPAITRETKAWSRWWWHGSAVTKEGITAELEAYKKAGLGGLEITPIYGVRGYEGEFVDFLSPKWIELFLHTLKEAERLDMGIDMATGTGWPFGGPWVTEEDACKNLNHKVYELKGGEGLREKIEFIQQPYLRAVGNQIYEVHDSFSTEKTAAQGTRKEPLARLDPKKLDITQLKQPISANNDLQAMAIDQVVFERPLPLRALIACSDDGQVMNLTSKVDQGGKLDWIAPQGNWKLFAVFEGSHGKMVERAGPGGEGNVIDHFSVVALKHYLNRFDSAFAGQDIKTLRAFFNDSYEVDDARGSADWTRTLFDEFRNRRGYDLEEHLPALFGHADIEKNERILCDYRETISEMVLDNFTTPWRGWAHDKSAIVRNQAHGAPSNILDLYGVVDIPEIEGVEPLRIKMASSAGNVTGKKLVSSESATWLNEHFESNLSDIKVALDRFMLNGVNHLFYHGTTYSPPGEPWPGWLFYAAVHLNPRNSLWNDFDALNEYVARCQSFLQNSTADNDVLLYYPIYDRFSKPGVEMIEHFDGIGKQFENSSFKRAAEMMITQGYAFDYISDKQIAKTQFEQGSLKTEGQSLYKTIVIPQGQYIPVGTFQRIISLAEQGATVIAFEGLPASAAGFGNVDKSKKDFEGLMSKIGEGKQVSEGIKETRLGGGRILIGNNIHALLSLASVRKEAIVNSGIQFIRKKGRDGRTVYFISNTDSVSFEGWLPLQVKAESVILYNPMNGEFGAARSKDGENNSTEVFVRLTSTQTLIIETCNDAFEIPSFKYYAITGTPRPLPGKWKISFESGGPKLPATVETENLVSWTIFGEHDYPGFSGTATYSLSFAKPEELATVWMLDLGIVKESAEVFLNGKSLGTLIGPVYQLYIEGSILNENNTLEVKVSNLMANRISDMDRRGIFWRKFYNVNFPARKNENRKNGLFDASHWSPKDSGLLGPIRLTPVDPSSQ